MVKTHAVWGGHHTLHAIGATFADEGFVGTKTWAHAGRRGAPGHSVRQPHRIAEAIIEAFALGQMRTGGIAGWRPRDGGRRRLRHGADRHRQAGHDAGCRRRGRAGAAAGPCIQPDAARGPSSPGALEKALGLNVEEASSVEQAVEGAPS